MLTYKKWFQNYLKLEHFVKFLDILEVKFVNSKIEIFLFNNVYKLMTISKLYIRSDYHYKIFYINILFIICYKKWFLSKHFENFCFHWYQSIRAPTSK